MLVMGTSLVDAEPQAEIETGEVVVVDGLDRGLRTMIPAEGLRIGTAPTNGLRLTDPTVSRIHCELRMERAWIHFSDLGSTNGSIANGMRVRDADLQLGSTIRLGGTTLRLLESDEKVSAPLSARTELGRLVGASPEMRRIYAIIERVAPGEATVLIRGETGTGKDLAARAIHDHSPRVNGPFVPVDCAAIAPSLVESELFGHVRGAFSGALTDRKGLFEEAEGGTLFLDEIGELPLAVQAKLLRVLESREVRRVGSNTHRPVDVRVLAATNRPIAPSVNNGSFREDLYYRLAVVEIEMPPVRARRGDIPLLIAHFHEQITGQDGPPPPELVSNLLSRTWPGNVRELRNVVERSLSLGPELLSPHVARSAELVVPAIDALVRQGLPMLDARRVWIDQFESAYVRALLRRTGGHVTRAAAEAGVSRRFLQKSMRRLGRPTLDDEAPQDGDTDDDT
jgi:transcriptional regulator with GAF, ATPase, and Fis domain